MPRAATVCLAAALGSAFLAGLFWEKGWVWAAGAWVAATLIWLWNAREEKQ